MKTYEEVADRTGLIGKKKERFIKYMRTRWGDKEDEAIKCQVGYASEWAERFKAEIEMSASDAEGKIVLSTIDAGHYGREWKLI